MNRFLVKVEDRPSDFDPMPLVNYQGDRFMGQGGIIYLMVDDPKIVNTWGDVVSQGPHHGDKVPPTLTDSNLKLINSVWTKRVPLDDITKNLYKGEDSKMEFYYIRDRLMAVLQL